MSDRMPDKMSEFICARWNVITRKNTCLLCWKPFFAMALSFFQVLVWIGVCDPQFNKSRQISQKQTKASLLAGVSFALAKYIAGRLDADAVIYHVELVLGHPC